jgi:uncharacterized protein YjdB
MTRSTRRIIYATLLVGLTGATLRCTDQSAIGPERVQRVRVVPESVSVAVGDTVRAAAFPIDADSAFLPNLPVSWMSEGVAIATVDGAGLITGIASGTTHISASSGGVAGVVAVSVP